MLIVVGVGNFFTYSDDIYTLGVVQHHLPWNKSIVEESISTKDVAFNEGAKAFKKLTVVGLSRFYAAVA